jgi:predicted DCC family thiol-disulfide oxidoreductase YuxK
LIEQFDLTREEVDREVWAIDADGRKFAGAAAINRVLQELGGIWAWLARLYRLAPIRWIEDLVYRWVAAHRGRLSRVWGAEPEWDE